MRGRTPVALFLGAPLLVLLLLPLGALLLASSPADLARSVRDPVFLPALWLSARTSAVSLTVVVATGTPLAWWLSATDRRAADVIEVLVDIPVVLPPAVLGIALLETFGRQGLLGPILAAAGLQIPFTSAAVILAQVVVSAPFYIQAATTGFRRLDPDLLLVARTLGHTGRQTFFRVALPLALPGVLAGAGLAWARALGEFGATLLFAGNLSGTTQTMPLAIYTALESDVRVAVALSLVLGAVGVFALVGLKMVPGMRWSRRRRADGIRGVRGPGATGPGATGPGPTP